MNRDSILIGVLLAGYPVAWRRRYGDEYAALLHDHLASTPRRAALIANALRGALDARLHPMGVSMPRSPMTTAIRAAGLFTVAGIGFQKLTEDPARTGIVQHEAAAGWSFTLLAAAALIGLGALVVAAVPTAVAMFRGRADRAWRFVPVPFVAFAAFYGVLRLASLLAAHHSVHSAPNIAAALIVVATGLGVVAMTAWAANAVIALVPAVQPPWLRRVTLAILAAGMAVATAACVIWGLALRAADPSGFASRDGLLASPFVPSWIATIVIMVLATAIAAIAARRESASPIASPA